MAAKEAKKTLRCKMTFPQKVVGQPVMHTLWSDFKVVSNTMRGRITEKGAWLEVELVGPAKNLEAALKFLSDQGVNVQPLD
jgi:ABC-type methionine transport system ATPase subunit